MAAVRRVYAHAPITEALVVIQVPPATDLDLESLVAVNERHDPPFPHQREALIGEVQLNLGADTESHASTKRLGYIFTDADGTTVAQVRADGLFISHLSPYRGWESLRDDAEAWWALYRETAKVEYATRIALRYINKLSLPAGTIDLKDYLRTFPELSSDMNQELQGYFFQVTSSQPEVGATLVLNQGTIPETDAGGLAVLLDMDLFVDGEFPATSDTLWDTIERLHDHKNRIFEACITERTRELIN